MLGRYQLRAKTLQALYACESHPEDERKIRNSLFASVDSVYDLYISLFSIIITLKELAIDKIEIGKTKNFPNTTTKNPNVAFKKNVCISLIENNLEIVKHLDKNKQLLWSINDTEIIKLYNQILNSQCFETHLLNENPGFNADKKLLLKIYQNHIADNPLVLDTLEDKNLHWADDIAIANTMVFATITSFTKKSDENLSLYKVYKNLDDKRFLGDLFDRNREHWDSLKEIIEKKSENWDIERIALVDRIIMQMALCEIKYFLDIPDRVSVNEYIEVAKEYSSEKSHVFINGILNKIINP